MSFGFQLSNVSLNGSMLETLKENKFLGLWLDNRLKFEIHINSLKSKLATNCYVIRVLSNELSSDILRSSYFALIESHIKHGICFWGTCSAQLFQSVFVLQKRAVRY